MTFAWTALSLRPPIERRHLVELVVVRLEADAGRLLVVLEELFINTIQHGYRNAEGMTRIELNQTPGYISIVYEDAAPAFDPFKEALADPGVSVNSRKVGGMGLGLIHKMADSLTHQRRGEWNRTTILMKSS